MVHFGNNFFTGLMTKPNSVKEGRWLVIWIAHNLTRLTSPCYNNTTSYNVYAHTIQESTNISS